MMQRKFVGLLAIVPLIILAAGCAGHDAGAGSASDPSALVPSPVTWLSGTWRGIYSEVASHRTGTPLHGDMVLRINEDGTFTATSARRPQRTGTVTATGRRVILNSAETGSRVTLMRSGNTLYGVVFDELTGATIAIQLDRIDQPGQ
jgi:hypothetical protein